MSIRRAGSLLTLLLLVVGGCASGGGAAGTTAADAVSVQIQIDNNLPGITGVVAYLIPQSGGRRSLGPVESNRVGTFDRNLRRGAYSFLASRVGAPDLISDTFRIDDGDVIVTWHMNTNQVSFSNR
jgi:hypothetical protein